MFAGYKTGEGTPEDLKAQFNLAERAVASLGVVVWPMVDFEADDAIATATSHCLLDPAVERVVVCSPDKDLAQLVEGDRVVCFDRRRGETLDDILGARTSVAEGVSNASSVSELASTLNIDMPICLAVDGILNRGADIDAAIQGLLSRPVTVEAGPGP